jgi:hypothetical protein
VNISQHRNTCSDCLAKDRRAAHPRICHSLAISVHVNLALIPLSACLL